MISVLEEVAAKGSNSGSHTVQYKVGERVLFIVLRNSPKHYAPGEKLAGTVIDAFDNAGERTYRVELDFVWNEHATNCPLGERIVIGNLRSRSLLPI